ncbi:MAG: PrsW family glutamic-type intramembrane protease, partial [Desulfosalsimonas sp.]
YFTGLKNKAMNEPIDALIYMITVALGFSAVENTIFLLGNETFLQTLLTGNMRFFGATLLHILASSIIGGAIALSFYKSKIKKAIYILIGFILASTLHSLFNIYIMNVSEKILFIFSIVWIGIVVLIIFFEFIKRKQRERSFIRNHYKNK